MDKRPKANLATFEHHCGTGAVIRRNAKGKLYAVCQGCGVLHYAGPKGQAYLQAALDQDAADEKRALQPEDEALEERLKQKHSYESGCLII